MWSAAVLAYGSKLSKANKRQGFFNEKTARNWKYWTIKTENKYVQMFKCANLQILSDVWCKELGQPVAVVGCKWSGANGATADRHDSRMIYLCLLVQNARSISWGGIFSTPQYYISNICEVEQTVQQLNRQSKVRQRGTNNRTGRMILMKQRATFEKSCAEYISSVHEWQFP